MFKSIFGSRHRWHVLVEMLMFSRSVPPQLLTFDTPVTTEAPSATCLHLLYKLSERRGPQVRAILGRLKAAVNAP